MIAAIVGVPLAVAVAVAVASYLHATSEPVPARPALVQPSPRPQAAPWPAAAEPVPDIRPWPGGPAGQGMADLVVIQAEAICSRQAALAGRPGAWADDTGSFAAVHFGSTR